MDFQKNKCLICKDEFSVLKFKRSYTCNRCGFNVCKNCSQHKIIIGV